MVPVSAPAGSCVGAQRRQLWAVLLQSFTFQLLRGVAFMHQHGIMHRDLKPQNLLVDPDAKVLKIADLGLGRVFSMPAKAFTHEVPPPYLSCKCLRPRDWLLGLPSCAVLAGIGNLPPRHTTLHCMWPGRFLRNT